MKRKLSALIAIALLVTMFAGSALADMQNFDADLTCQYNDKLYGDIDAWYKDDDSRAWLSILLYLDIFGAEVMETSELLQYDIRESFVGYELENGIMMACYPGKTDVLVIMYAPAAGKSAWGILTFEPTNANISTSMNSVCVQYTKINPMSYDTIWGELTAD